MPSAESRTRGSGAGEGARPTSQLLVARLAFDSVFMMIAIGFSALFRLDEPAPELLRNCAIKSVELLLEPVELLEPDAESRDDAPPWCP